MREGVVLDVVTEATYLLVAYLPAGYLDAGFEKYFLVPYLGRTEFETPGRYLAHLDQDAQGLPVVEEHWISALGRVRPVYFVGPPGNLPHAARLMPDWLHAGAPSKVPVWFLASFLDDDDGLDFLGDHRPLAWWALSSRFMFTLDHAHADRLKAAIREEMATRASFGTRRW